MEQNWKGQSFEFLPPAPVFSFQHGGRQTKKTLERNSKINISTPIVGWSRTNVFYPFIRSFHSIIPHALYHSEKPCREF